MPDELPFTHMAEAIADGHPLDWDDIERGMAGRSDRDAIAALRQVADVGDLFAGLVRTLGPADRPAPLDAGTTWGGLRIVEHVGNGRYGDVYRAWDPALDRHVALKLVGCDTPAEAGAPVVDEGRLMARVRHPNVVAVYGAQRIGDVAGLSMEFVEGRTLEAELAAQGPVSADDLARIGRDLAAALGAVHDAGLVHRDVKASNVLVESSGRVVLGDFGTGRELEEASAAVGLVGTPAYVAPEIFAGEPATARSDVYSLGVLLFRLATGEFPQPATTLRDLRDAHQLATPRALRDVRPDLPSTLAQIVDRALDRNPAKRFASGDEMARAFARRHGTSGVADASLPLRRPATRWLVLTAGALAAGGFLLFRPTGGRSTGGEGGATVTTLPFQERAGFRGPAVGSWIACVDDLDTANQMIRPGQWFGVSICNISTGERISLKPGSPEGQTALFMGARLSPTGSEVAYLWRVPSDEGWSHSVGVIGSDRSNDRIVYEAAAGRQLNLRGWRPGGDGLVVVEGGGEASHNTVLVVPTNGGTAREVYTLENRELRVDMSPDGRFLVFERWRQLGTPALGQDLISVNVDTGDEALVSPGSTDDTNPRWTPDGNAIVFVSRRHIGYSVVVQDVVDGRPVGLAREGATFGTQHLLFHGFGPDGGLFVMVMPQEYSAFSASVDVAGARLGEPVPLDAAIIGITLGPDLNGGFRTAFLHSGGGTTLTVASANGATQTSLDAYRLAHLGPVRWSPSGRELAVVLRASEGTRHDLLRIVPGPEPEIEVVRSGPTSLRTVRWDSEGRLYYLRGASVFRVDARERDPLTSGDELVVAPPPDGSVRNPTGFDISPADDSIAMAVYRPPMTRSHATGCTVRIVPMNGPPIDGHTFLEACWAIAWSADGKHILLSTLDGETPRLWRLDETGRNPVGIDTSHLIGYIVDLSFSDDGTAMLFTAKGPADWMGVVRGLDSGRQPPR